MEEAISIIFVIIFRKLLGQTSPVRLVRSQLGYFYRTEKNPVNFPSPQAEICTCMIINMWSRAGWQLRRITG